MNRPGDGLAGWCGGNTVSLLENGEAFFPRVFEAIDGACEEILLETFILFEDEVGCELQRRLVAAGRRGVRVVMTVDGYGSPSFSPGFLAGLAEAGVRLNVFDPHPTRLGFRLHIFRRLHRKLVVIDGACAFAGGINFSAEHLGDFGPRSKQDYAVEVRGPAVEDIRAFMRSRLDVHGVQAWTPVLQPGPAVPVRAGERGGAQVLFEIRDNELRRTGIERQYRQAIRAAQHEIVIANAYFFPGYGFLYELRAAARRGVDVVLILQGEPDKPYAAFAAHALYRDLIEAGVRVCEYRARPLHAKVALVDEDWATVGSSNLDPLSLSLNLEANIFVRDPGFNRILRERLRLLQERHCRWVDPATLPRRSLWGRLSHPLLFHVLRRFPAWAGLLPAHTQRLVAARPATPSRPRT